MHRDLSREIITPSLLRRLWSRIPITTEDACWEWEGARTPQGYGRIRVTDPTTGKSRDEYTHRLVCLSVHGEDIPAGMVVMHSCDNPPCCNPAHLRLGTPLDNMQDRDAKGRGLKQPVTSLRPDPHAYREFIAFLYRGGMSLRDVAELFSCGRTAIANILGGMGVERRNRGSGK